METSGQMRSIRVRLIVAMLSLIVILTTVLSVTFIQQTASSVILNQDKSSTRLASLVAERIADAVRREDHDAILVGIGAIIAMDDVTGATVTHRDGHVLADVGARTGRSGETVTESDITRLGLPGSAIKRIVTGRGVSTTVPIIDGTTRIGAFTIHHNTDQIRGEVARIAALAVAIAILVGIIGTMSAMALQTMITRPLHKVAMAMDIAGRTGRYTETIPEVGPTETAVIARTFNAMITRIGARDQALQERKAELESKVRSRTRDLEIAKNSAESANVAKSVFLATMSHEIRTPLNGMLVMAELLAKSELGPKQKRYAEVVESSGRSLVNIINDVLDISKIEAGALTIDPIAINARKLVADVVDIFAEKAASKDLDLAGYVDVGVAETIIADPIRLKQVLSNFVNNAIKFTADGYVYVEMNQEDDRILISVRDTGIGIKPENQSRIFQPFAQESTSIVREYGGTGLGLSICKKLVDAMDGRLGVESEPGRGSVFFVDLPCVVAEPQPAPWSEEALDDLRERSVGVVVSEAIGVRVLAQTLADVGIKVVDVSVANAEPDALATLDILIGAPDEVTSLVEMLTPEDALALRDALVCAAPMSSGRRDWLKDSGHVGHIINLPTSRDQLISELLAILGTGGQTPAAEPTEGIVGPRFPTLRALVADDNAVNREVMAAILDQFDVDTAFVCDGAEALETCRAKRFDVVFMDINMPVMDGIEAVSRIRSFEVSTGAERVPIVALTAHGATLHDRPWHEHGFDAYIGKPVRVADIRQALLGFEFESVEAASPAASDVGGPREYPMQDTFVDWSTIEALTRTLDADQRRNLYETVLGIYCADAPKQYDALVAAVASNKADDVRLTSHALKSVSLNVGAVRVAQIASGIEAAARDGRIEAGPDVLDDLVGALDRTIVVFNERTRAAA